MLATYRGPRACDRVSQLTLVPRNNAMHRWRLIPILLLGLSTPVCAVDHVVFKRDGHEHRVSGKLLVHAADGGLLVMSPDGVLWNVQPDELVEHTTDETKFKPLSTQELAAKLAGD